MIQPTTKQLIALLKDAEADLLVLEKVVCRQVPEFESKTLKSVREAIASMSENDDALVCQPATLAAEGVDQ